VYSTMHADSARSVVYRLENEPINIPRLVLQALDVIAIQAQTRVKGKRVRRIMEVVELVGMDPATKELLTNTVFKWDPATDSFEYAGRSYMLERIAQERNWTRGQVRAEFARRQDVLRAMAEAGVKDVRQLTDLVKAYYRDPEALARSLGVTAAGP
jgi:flagellar protein FlaI